MFTFLSTFCLPYFSIRIFPSAFYHPHHFIIRIFPSAFFRLHFIIRILLSAIFPSAVVILIFPSAFYYPYFSIRIESSAFYYPQFFHRICHPHLIAFDHAHFSFRIYHPPVVMRILSCANSFPSAVVRSSLYRDQLLTIRGQVLSWQFLSRLKRRQISISYFRNTRKKQRCCWFCPISTRAGKNFVASPLKKKFLIGTWKSRTLGTM